MRQRSPVLAPVAGRSLEFLQLAKKRSGRIRAKAHSIAPFIGPIHPLFLFLAGLAGSGWFPVTEASSVSNASLAVISLLRLLFCRYLCSLSQVRQRVSATSSPFMATIQ